MILDERPKLLYVARRHPGFTPEGFTARWRSHAALGMRQPRWRNVALYLHCDRAQGLPADLPVLDGDGMAVVVYRSEAARQAHVADTEARRTMKADELETFAHPVAEASLLVREELVRPAPLPGWRLFVCDAGATALPEGIGHLRNHVRTALGSWTCSRVDEFTAQDAAPLVALAIALARSNTLTTPPSMMLTRTVVLHDLPVPPSQ